MNGRMLFVLFAAYILALCAAAITKTYSELLGILEEMKGLDVYVASRLGEGQVRLGAWNHPYVMSAFTNNPFANKSFHLVRNHYSTTHEHENIFEIHVGFTPSNRKNVFTHLLSIFIENASFKYADRMLGISYDPADFPDVFVIRFMGNELYQEVGGAIWELSAEHKWGSPVTGFTIERFSNTMLGIPAERGSKSRFNLSLEDKDTNTEFTLKEAFEYIYLLKEFGGVSDFDITQRGYAHEEGKTSELTIGFPTIGFTTQSLYFSNIFLKFVHECVNGPDSKYFSRIISFTVEKVVERFSSSLRLRFRYPAIMDVSDLTSRLTYMTYMTIAETVLDIPKNVNTFHPATFISEDNKPSPCNSPVDFSKKALLSLKRDPKKQIILKFNGKPGDEPVNSLVFLKSTFKLTKNVDLGKLFTTLYELIGSPENKKLQDIMLQDIRFSPSAPGLVDRCSIQLTFANKKGPIGHAMGIFYMILQAFGIEDIPIARFLGTMKTNAKESVLKLEHPVESKLTEKRAEIKVQSIGRAAAPLESSQQPDSTVETMEKPARGLTKSVMSKKKARRLRAKNAPLVRVPVEIIIETPKPVALEKFDSAIPEDVVKIDETSSSSGEEVETAEMPRKKRKIPTCTKVLREAREKARLEKERRSTALASLEEVIPKTENREVNEIPDTSEEVIPEKESFEINEIPESLDQIADDEVGAEEDIEDEPASIQDFGCRETVMQHAEEVKIEEAITLGAGVIECKVEIVEGVPENIIIGDDQEDIANETIDTEPEIVADTIVASPFPRRQKRKSCQSLRCSKQITPKSCEWEEPPVTPSADEKLGEDEAHLDDCEVKSRSSDDSPAFQKIASNHMSSLLEVGPIMPMSIAHIGILTQTIFGPIIRTSSTDADPDSRFYPSPLVMLTPKGQPLTFAVNSGSWSTIGQDLYQFENNPGMAIHVIRKKLYTTRPPSNGPRFLSLIVEIPEGLEMDILQKTMEWIETVQSEYVRHRTLSVSLVGSGRNLLNEDRPNGSAFLVFTLCYPYDHVMGWLDGCSRIIGTSFLQYKCVIGDRFAPTQISDLKENHFFRIRKVYPAHQVSKTYARLSQPKNFTTQLLFKSRTLNLSYVSSVESQIAEKIVTDNLTLSIADIFTRLPFDYLSSGNDFTVLLEGSERVDIEYLTAVMPASDNTLGNALKIFELVLGAKDTPIVSLVLCLDESKKTSFKFGFSTSLTLADIRTIKKLTSSISKDIKWKFAI